MKIYLNGQLIETQTKNIYDLFLEMNIDIACVATAIDGNFVSRQAYPTTLLVQGQKIEVLSAMQGG